MPLDNQTIQQYQPFLKNYTNDSWRRCSYGDLGSGKTLCTVRWAQLYHYFNWKAPVYANIHIRLPCKVREIDSPSVLFDIDEACFMDLDEWWHVSDSHRCMSTVSNVMSMIMLRSRKKRWHVAITEQYYTQLELRLRFSTDLWVSPYVNDKTGRCYMQYYTKHGTKLRKKSFQGSLYYHDYDSTEDPLTLDIDDLKKEYDAYIRKKNSTGGRQGEKDRQELKELTQLQQQQKQWNDRFPKANPLSI